MRLLLVEDEPNIARPLKRALEAQGHQVSHASDLTEARALLAESEPDLMILDVRLPGSEDGGFILAREAASRAGVPYRGPETLKLSGDPFLLAQALENLLSNAQKYAPGAQVRLELGHSDDRQFAILSVQDEGPGMPPEVLQRAIEPFYRAPGTRVSGNGLGLSVAAQVAQVHGGRLVLRSLEPHGLAAELWIRVQSA